jgi:hypothetical protein
VGFVIEEHSHFEPLMNDLAGSRIPLDTQDMGEEHTVVGNLTRWNEPVFDRLSAHPSPVGVPGVSAFGDRGTFVLLEGGSVIVWLVFPYYLKPAMRLGGMPRGRRYPFTTVMTKKLEPLGSRAMKRFMALHCMPAFSVRTGGFLTYDQDMTGIPFGANGPVIN